MNALADLPLHGVAIYNPDLLSKQELISQFVARRTLLSRLLEDLARARTTQHHLVIGQRGMGKTTLLRRLRYAVEDDPALAATWLPLTFPEEQYNVARLSDLYLNLIDALGDALDRMGRSREAKELDAARERLPDRDEGERARRALDLLRYGADQVERRLLLLVDNIDLIFDRLKADQWAIRELLASEPRLLLIGASSVMLESTYEYKAPFYDFFLTHELRGLGEEETGEVLLQLAKVGNAPEIERVVTNEPGRIKTFHVLAGGNPRTVVLLYDVLAKGVEGDVRTDLERLLDRVTPLYKARFEALPAQAQQVVDALAIHWDPTSAGELAAAVRLEVNAVSSQLSRLEKQGVVEKVAYPPGNKAGFQVAERLFNIWYLMRASRRVRQRLIWLVEFLRVLYAGGEIRGVAERYLRGKEGGDAESRMRRAEYGLALAQVVQDTPLRGALEGVSVHALVIDQDLREQLPSIMDLEGDDAALRPVVDRHKAMAQIREAIFAAKVRWQPWDPEGFWMLLGGATTLSQRRKMALAMQLGYQPKEEVLRWMAWLQERAAKMEALIHCPAAVEKLRNAFASGYMVDMNDMEAARAAALALDAPDIAAIAIASTASRSYDPSVLEALTEAARAARAPYPYVVLGDVLRRKLVRYEEAEAAYRKAVELAPRYPLAWGVLGILLHYDLGRREEAEAAYRRAIQLDPRDALAWDNLGRVLHYNLGRYDEAEAAYRKAVELDPRYAESWDALGEVMLRAGRLGDAEDARRRAVEIDREDAGYLNNLAWVRYLSNKLDAAAEDARRAVACAPDEANYVHTLATVLAARGDWPEAASLAPRFFAQGSSLFEERVWPETLHFFREAARTGHAADAVRLLDDLSLTDRFRPLREALAAIAAGSRLPLRRVAPENPPPRRGAARRALARGAGVTRARRGGP